MYMLSRCIYSIYTKNALTRLKTGCFTAIKNSFVVSYLYFCLRFILAFFFISHFCLFIFVLLRARFRVKCVVLLHTSPLLSHVLRGFSHLWKDNPWHFVVYIQVLLILYFTLLFTSCLSFRLANGIFANNSISIVSIFSNLILFRFRLILSFIFSSPSNAFRLNNSPYYGFYSR